MLTTFLHDGELNQPSGDAENDEYLADVRAITGDDYQIIKRTSCYRYGFMWLRTGYRQHVQLHVYVGGIAPWQVLGCAHDVPTIRAYLLGVINGYRKAARMKKEPTNDN